jgi:hypothetical protein
MRVRSLRWTDDGVLYLHPGVDHAGAGHAGPARFERSGASWPRTVDRPREQVSRRTAATGLRLRVHPQSRCSELYERSAQHVVGRASRGFTELRAGRENKKVLAVTLLPGSSNHRWNCGAHCRNTVLAGVRLRKLERGQRRRRSVMTASSHKLNSFGMKTINVISGVR